MAVEEPFSWAWVSPEDAARLDAIRAEAEQRQHAAWTEAELRTAMAMAERRSRAAGYRHDPDDDDGPPLRNLTGAEALARVTEFRPVPL